jgi:hypothetical protein
VKSDQDTTGLSGGGSRSLLPGSGAVWLETGEALNYIRTGSGSRRSLRHSRHLTSVLRFGQKRRACTSKKHFGTCIWVTALPPRCEAVALPRR